MHNIYTCKITTLLSGRVFFEDVQALNLSSSNLNC